MTRSGGSGLPADIDATDEPPTHIPGSAIDFRDVHCLYLVESHSVRPLHRDDPAYAHIRLAAPEQLVEVAVPPMAAVGDIVATRGVKRGTATVGRPMQIRHRYRDVAIAVDDPTLGDEVTVEGLLADESVRSGPGQATVWTVLDAWNVFRCPRCRAPGRLIRYGFALGQPPLGWIDAGCSLLPGSGDVRCSRCGAEWCAPSHEDD